MRNPIKFLTVIFVLAALLLFSCQNDESQVIEHPDVLSKNATLTNKLKQATFSNDFTSVDNVLDSTSCFKVKFPYRVTVNDNFATTVQSEVDYAEVAAIFNASQIDQDHIEFSFPIIVNTIEGGTVVINNEQEFNTLSVSCQHSEEVFPCLQLMFPITVYSYDANFQVQQTHTLNSSSEVYLFLAGLVEGESYQIAYPLYIPQANGENVEIDSNAALLSAVENAINICNPTVPPCQNPNILTNGLIIYMPFANEIKDLISNQNALPGNNFPPVFVSDRNGTANSAISLSGQVGDFLAIPEVQANHLKQGDSITISIWFKQKLPDNSGVHGFFEKANNCVCDDGFTLGYFERPLFGQSGGFSDPSWTAELHQDTENWHHILITLTPGNFLKIYRDGILRNSVYYEQLNFGEWFGNYLIGKQFNGYLDDLRVYKRVLSDDEVQQLYNLEGDNNTCF